MVIPLIGLGCRRRRRPAAFSAQLLFDSVLEQAACFHEREVDPELLGAERLNAVRAGIGGRGDHFPESTCFKSKAMCCSSLHHKVRFAVKVD